MNNPILPCIYADDVEKTFSTILLLWVFKNKRFTAFPVIIKIQIDTFWARDCKKCQNFKI